MSRILKIALVMLFCSFWFSKLGVPAAVILFEFDFVKSVTVSCVGGIAGSIFYTYVSAGLIRWWTNLKRKRQKFEKKRIFTKGNRRIIKIKNRFGLMGIAILAPLILSIPLGAFLGEKFYKKKWKVIGYMSVWVVIWSVVLYFVFYLFHDFFKGWLL